MRILRFAAILFTIFTATGASAEDWAPGTTLKEKTEFAAHYAAARCGSKRVGGDSSMPDWVSKQMVVSYINGMCPAKRR